MLTQSLPLVANRYYVYKQMCYKAVKHNIKNCFVMFRHLPSSGIFVIAANSILIVICVPQ
jgi:hypothetical protein